MPTPIAFEILKNKRDGAIALSFNSVFSFSPQEYEDQISISGNAIAIHAAAGDTYLCNEVPDALLDRVRADGKMLLIQFDESNPPASKTCLLRN